jgi:alpha/beta superfamily hydrolase
LTARTTERFTIDGPAGTLEVAIGHPVHAPSGIALVAHPNPVQGGTLDNKVAQTLARSFQGLGYASVRFNFRGVGASEGTFDEGIGETDDAHAALDHARTRFGRGLPLVLAGFSFGCFVQARVGREVAPQRLVLIAPAVGRFTLGTVPVDTLVVHGEEDDVVPLADVLAWARPQGLPIVVFPGCGHFFHGWLPKLSATIAGNWHGAPPVVPGA